jgi:sigma-B regulation protein RsbU (phosphoserine phosphatase)
VSESAPAPTGNDPRPLNDEARCALLLEISRRSRGTLDLGETLDLLLDAVATVVDYDAAGIFALNEDLFPHRNRRHGVIAGVAHRGFLSRPAVADEMLREGRGLVGHAIRSGRPVLVPDVRQDPRYVVGREQTQSEIVVPITVDGRTIAALNLESDRIGAFDLRHLAALAFFAEAAALAIEKSMLHGHLLALQREKDERDRQLQIAREVQAGLLPTAAPPLPGWDLAGRCVPSLELGGDSFDFFPLPDGRVAVVIADVAGKGIPAALIMATFRALLRARSESGDDPAAVVADVGRLLRASVASRAFVTCCFANLDPASGEVLYASCGHPLGVLERASGRREELVNGGPALGAFDGASYASERTELRPGDRLVLYTDGLTEATTPAGEPLGLAPLLACLTRYPRASATTLVEAILSETRQVADEDHLADDLTLVVVAREPAAGAA